MSAPVPAPEPAHRPPVPEAPRHPGAGAPEPPLTARARAPPSVHHVASNTDSTVGPVTGVLLALDVGFLGSIALAELWGSIQDDDDA